VQPEIVDAAHASKPVAGGGKGFMMTLMCH
jgi:hypothetical protein